MGISSKMASMMHSSSPADEEQRVAAPAAGDGEKAQSQEDVLNSFSDKAQSGVRKVEAAAMVWDKRHLIAVYAL